jgi:uncharacterized protein (DUF302 family)
MTSDRTLTEAGVVTKRSHQSVHDTAAKLTAMITAKGMRLFAVIDQAAEARHHLTADLAANLAGISALTDALVAS